MNCILLITRKVSLPQKQKKKIHSLSFLIRGAPNIHSITQACLTFLCQTAASFYWISVNINHAPHFGRTGATFRSEQLPPGGENKAAMITTISLKGQKTLFFCLCSVEDTSKGIKPLPWAPAFKGLLFAVCLLQSLKNFKNMNIHFLIMWVFHLW